MLPSGSTPVTTAATEKAIFSDRSTLPTPVAAEVELMSSCGAILKGVVPSPGVTSKPFADLGRGGAIGTVAELGLVVHLDLYRQDVPDPRGAGVAEEVGAIVVPEGTADSNAAMPENHRTRKA